MTLLEITSIKLQECEVKRVKEQGFHFQARMTLIGEVGKFTLTVSDESNKLSQCKREFQLTEGVSYGFIDL